MLLDLSQTNLSGSLPSVWGDRGSLPSLTTFSLGGSYCMKISSTWLQRQVLSGALVGVTYTYCSGTATGENSATIGPNSSSLTATGTFTSSRNVSFTVSPSWSNTGSRSSSVSRRTIGVSTTATEVSSAATQWITPSRTASVALTLTPGRLPTNTSSKTVGPRSSTELLSFSMTLPLLSNSYVSASLSVRASNTSDVSRSWSLLGTPTQIMKVTASITTSTTQRMAMISVGTAFTTAHSLSASVVAAGLISSVLSSSFSSTVQLIQLGKATQQMMHAACLNSSVQGDAPFSDWMDNPLQLKAIRFLPVELQSAGGAILGNCVLMLAVLLVRCGLSIGRRLTRGKGFRWSVLETLVRWPSCASVPLEPVLSASVLLVASPGRNTASTTFGCVSIVVFALSIVVVHVQAALSIGPENIAVLPAPVVVSDVPRRLRTWSTILRGWWRWLVRERWCWIAVGGPSRQQTRDAEARLVLLKPYRSPDFVWTPIILEVGWTALCSALVSVGIASAGNCGLCLRLAWTLFSLGVARTALFLFFRPMSSVAENTEQCIMASLNAVLLLIACVGQNDSSGPNVVTIVELALLFVKATYQIWQRLLSIGIDKRVKGSGVGFRRLQIGTGNLLSSEYNQTYADQLEVLIRTICDAQ